MATLKPLRRSVSPFGIPESEPSVYSELESKFAEVFGLADESEKPTLESFQNAVHVPTFFKKLHAAAANDAPQLQHLSRFLLTHKHEFEFKGLDELLFHSMEQLFNQKTEVFLIDHLSKETLEKMGIQGESQDVVLFAKERDELLGGFFWPATEKNPGKFSELINHWGETENLDRLLHFLDFSLNSKNPSFEHYLMFAHPALQRILTNKGHMQQLLKKTEPLLKKLSSTTWETELRKSLN